MTTIPKKLTNIQLELIKYFSDDVSEKEVLDIKKMLSEYFGGKEMNRLKKYQVVLEYVQSHKEWIENNTEYEYHLISDEKTGHIQLFKTNFEKTKFNFVVIFHFQIKEDGQVWVLVNDTDIEVGIELMKRGISNQEIVIGFIALKYREYSPYAST